MHLSLTLLITALAQITIAQNPFTYNAGDLTSITAGSSFTIKWGASTGTTDTVTLYLRQGDPSKLVTVMTIASSINNTGSYLWSVPSTLVNGGNYTFEIVDDGNKDLANYSNQFSIVSTNTVSSAIAPSVTATVTSDGKTSTVVATETGGSASLSSVSATGTGSASATSESTTASSSPSPSPSAAKNAGGVKKVKLGSAMLGLVAGVMAAL
ncbi:hypothetical protein EG329_010646 [Mollisiaceae sp. DMI_Dod_QoI]|nr:hypothetical protein EG329_010646 [Helotiales sp. DMI_Dod_QoI]